MSGRRINRITWTQEETGRETMWSSACTIQAAYAPASGTDVLVDSGKKKKTRKSKDVLFSSCGVSNYSFLTLNMP